VHFCEPLSCHCKLMPAIARIEENLKEFKRLFWRLGLESASPLLRDGELMGKNEKWCK